MFEFDIPSRIRFFVVKWKWRRSGVSKFKFMINSSLDRLNFKEFILIAFYPILPNTHGRNTTLKVKVWVKNKGTRKGKV